jgi:hypothetical protein
MILYFFDKILEERKVPENIIDLNLKTDYGRLQRLAQHERNRDRLIQIVKDEGITTHILEKFSIDSLTEDDYFVSLLFYMGLLTIKKPYFAGVFLGIPNYSIKTLYWEYISRLTQNYPDT